MSFLQKIDLRKNSLHKSVENRTGFESEQPCIAYHLIWTTKEE